MINAVNRVIDILNHLVGMNSIKEEVKSLINLIKVQKLCQQKGLPNISMSFHSVRIIKINDLDQETMTLILPEDIP